MACFVLLKTQSIISPTLLYRAVLSRQINAYCILHKVFLHVLIAQELKKDDKIDWLWPLDSLFPESFIDLFVVI